MIFPRTVESMIKFFPVSSLIALITSVISTFGKSKDSIVSGKFSFVMSSALAFANLFFCVFGRTELPPVGLIIISPPLGVVGALLGVTAGTPNRGTLWAAPELKLSTGGGIGGGGGGISSN